MRRLWHLPAGILLLRFVFAADLQPVLVLLPGSQAAPDMAFRFINIQNHPGLGGQGGVNVLQTVGDVCWCPIRNKKF